LKILYS